MIRAAWIGLLAGVVGTGLGGLLASFINFRDKRILGFFLAGSAGVMTSISLIELVPEAISIGGKPSAAFGLITGTIFLLMLDVLLPHRHWDTSDTVSDFPGEGHKHQKGRGRGSGRRDHGGRSLRDIGLLIAIGIALHNVPEGLAIGSSYAHTASFGFGVALLIALHNIPEGIAVAIPLRADGLSFWNVLASTVTAGAPTGFGALVGAWVGAISPEVLSASLGFAAGAMMYVVGDELLPEAHNYGEGHHSTFGLVAGIIIGAVVAFVAH